MIKGHGGNIYEISKKLSCNPEEIIDMSSNLNPIGPPPFLISYIKEHIHSILSLPEVDSLSVINAFSEMHNINPQNILVGNGTTQFIYIIPKALKSKNCLILSPTYSDYADACLMNEACFHHFLSYEQDLFEVNITKLQEKIKCYDLVFICNPNNPTGTLISKIDLLKLCCDNPNTYFVIDESYLPFVYYGEKESLLGVSLPNLIILNSMSKIFRIPGIRIGFIIASDKIIENIYHYMLPWSVNSIAQLIAITILSNYEEIFKFIEDTRKYIINEKKIFKEKLKNKIKIFPSFTSFMLLKLYEPLNSDIICNGMLQHKILIRNCSNFKGLSNQFIRISLKNRELNAFFLEKFLSLL
ncbi:MAG: aminotransferase class I/II-fold pyridoxal phosphate-dependent enzyme [Desulfobacterales bacterium]|nr:aminotransferase class I/II-fold pyridoxal phosphate-dependent enzyme [Desulfobacterales bacterium]